MDARRAALAALIDHAPTFPPASMPAAEAIADDRRARADEHAWMLRRLVWPATRIAELANEERALSIILDGDWSGDARAEAVETRWGDELFGLIGEVYVELPLDDRLEASVAVLAERGFRAKVRCGGAEVPTAAALGRFLETCRAAEVPFKATAGLHHPLAAEGRHGFLNVLAACAFENNSALVEDIELSASGLRWDGREAGTDELLRARREQLVAVGSCSFFEPVVELQELGIL